MVVLGGLSQILQGEEFNCYNQHFDRQLLLCPSLLLAATQKSGRDKDGDVYAPGEAFLPGPGHGRLREVRV